MSTMSDFVNSGSSNQAQVDAMAKVLSYMPNRNRIINGKMEIVQRGTNFPAVSVSTYPTDRFFYGGSSNAVVTASQQSDAPSEFSKSLRISCTTADTVVDAGDYKYVRTIIEGYNVVGLVSESFVLSFWVKSSKVGTYCIALRNTDNTMSYISEYVINSPNTWEFKTIKVPTGLPNSGTWDFTNGIGLQVYWMLLTGSSVHTATTDSWLNGAFLGTPEQVNCLDTVGNIFAITGVQLEAGEVATPFEHRPYGQELALCQRYFCKSYEVNTLIGASTGAGAHGIQVGTATTNTLATQLNFAVPMRTAPTITLYDLAGASGKATRGGVNGTPGSAVSSSSTGFLLASTGTNSASEFYAHWVASAEL